LTKHLRKEFILIFIGLVVLDGLIATGVKGFPNALAIVRLVLGLIYVLFIPGYTLQLFLIPSTIELDPIERTAISFALSIAIVPLFTLVLDWLPWGISLWPFVISLSIFILVCMIGATIRQLQLPEDRQFTPISWNILRTSWERQDRLQKFVYILTSFTILITVLITLAILVLPKPAQSFTEFYLLGSDRLAESYPNQVAPSEIISVTIGVNNLERKPMDYRLEVWQADPTGERQRQLVGTAIPFSLQSGETNEWIQEWRAAWFGQNQRFEFLLYKADQIEPYRRLLLWMDIIE
jgi:uncharacterized membrane protein